MNNGKGKCKTEPPSDDDEESKKIDLTLKLGPSSAHYTQNQQEEVHGFSSQSSNAMGNWNVGVASYCTASEGGSTNYMPTLMYPTFIPSYNNNAASTTPTRKRPISDDTKSCKACGSNTTPLWRKGPDGPQTLCNACGLRHLRTAKRNGDNK